MNRYRKKSRRAAENFAHYGKGWSAGYANHRYGTIQIGEKGSNKVVDENSRITLPQVSIQRQPIIRSADKLKHLATKAADLLREVTFSLWENEAGVRHGLRVGFIRQGHGWQAADDEAARIVRHAFNRLGRGVERRPTAEQAAPEYLIPRENCAVCNAPLDDQQIAMRLRYCCIEHARFAWQVREYAEGWHNSELGTAAYRMVYRERFKERTCANPKCRHPRFRPASENQTYCSKACLYEVQTVEYPPRVCDLPSCEEVFTPTARHPQQRYCCHKHALDAKKTREAQQCARPGCGNWFVSSHNNATEGGRRGLFCSRECADAMRGVERHDLVCKCCGDPFKAAMPNAVACSNAHYQILRKFEAGRPPKRLSAPVFDYLFFRDQPQEAHPILQLFDQAA